MSKMHDLTNQKFGKLTVKSMVKNPQKMGWSCNCICECGNESIIESRNLKGGLTKSCGCNVNQSEILKFKKDNPKATEQEILQKRVLSKCKWEGECLIHQGNLMKSGYCGMMLNGKTRNAHRVAWIAFKGDIPLGEVVCHKCDNRRCCNVEHLFLGSHKDNTKDMVEKGRDNWQTCRKFPEGTREKVGSLRESGKLYREICVELGLTMDQVKSLLQNYKRKKRIEFKSQK